MSKVREMPEGLFDDELSAVAAPLNTVNEDAKTVAYESQTESMKDEQKVIDEKGNEF